MPETGFLGRMTAPLRAVTDFGGRTRRADYWPYMLLLFGIYVIGLVTVIAAASSLAGGSLIAHMYALTAALILLAFAATVRRLHDVGWSGRWMGAYVFMSLSFIAAFFVWHHNLAGTPQIYTQSPTYLRLMPLMMAFSMIMNGLGLFVFVLCLLDGNAGQNRYGPDPKGRSTP